MVNVVHLLTLIATASVLHAATHDLVIPVSTSRLPLAFTDVTLQHGSNQLTVGTLPPGTVHLLVQAHSPFNPLTLSSFDTYNYSFSKNGSHIGLLLSPSQTTFYVNSQYAAITVWFRATAYTAQDPIAGGCNQVFNLEYDPNLAIDQEGSAPLAPPPLTPLDNWVHNVQFALGGLWIGNRSQQHVSCDSAVLHQELSYQLYVLPLAIAGGGHKGGRDVSDCIWGGPTSKQVMQAIAAVSNSQFDPLASPLATYTVTPGHPSNFPLARHHGTAVVVTVVIKYSPIGASAQETTASYVPTVIYSCPPNTDSSKEIPSEVRQNSARFGCQLIPGSFILVTIAFSILAAFGLFLPILAYKLPGLNAVLQWTVLIALTGFLIAHGFGHGWVNVTIFASIAGGALLLSLLLTCCAYCCCSGSQGHHNSKHTRFHFFPSLVLATFLMVAAICFSSFGDFEAMKQLTLFALIAMCLTIVTVIILLPFDNFASALAPPVVGVYVLLASISVAYLPGCLFPYFLIDHYLRLVVPGYVSVARYSPFGYVDWILLGVWLGIVFLCFVISLPFYIGRSRGVASFSRTRTSLGDRQALLYYNQDQAYGSASADILRVDASIPPLQLETPNASPGTRHIFE